MRKIIAIFLLLMIAGAPSARSQHFDRGFDVNSTTFVTQGQWLVGGNISFSTHDNTDYKFLVIKDIDSRGYNFAVRPMFAYVFRDNMAIGGRFGYKRTLLKVHSADLDFEDIDMGVDEYYRLKHTIEGGVLFRYYIPLGQNKRFAIYNELGLTLGIGQAKLFNGEGDAMIGAYERQFDIALGMSPGLVAFANNNLAVEVNVGVLGIQYSSTQTEKNQIYEGSRNTTLMNFRINLLSIGLGVAYYF